jgi:hypothetical protein
MTCLIAIRSSASSLHTIMLKTLTNSFVGGLIWAACAASVCRPTTASAATLQGLFGGATLTVGNARFDNWQLLSADHTSGAAFDFSLMSMSAIGSDPSNPGLQFGSGGQLAVNGINAADLTFRYQVHAIGASNSFAAHSLNMTGVTFAGPGGIATISQEVTTIDGVDLGPAVTLADNVADVFEFADAQAIAPHLNLQVTVNVFVTGLVAADAINFTAFTQRFAQTGPTTLPGDFNNDKKVDGADFLRWQRGLSPSPLSQGDLTIWKNNFGQSILATPTATAVPEPCGIGGTLLAATFALSRRKRRIAGN